MRRWGSVSAAGLMLAACSGSGGGSGATVATVGTPTGATPAPSPTPTPTPTPTPSATGTVALRPDTAQVTRPGAFRIQVDATGDVRTIALYRNGQLIDSHSADDPRFRLPYTRSAQTTDTIEARGLDANGTVIATTSQPLPVNIGRILYVGGSGNDANDGLSEATAKRTLQATANITQPGDSVLVMDGTYSVANPSQDVLTINRNGTANNWIAYIGYPGQSPLISARNWNAISVQASYILVQDMTMQGNLNEITLDQAQAAQNDLNNPITSGNGIGIRVPFNNPTGYVSHITIRGCTVHDFPGGGIGSVRADYITVTENVVYRTSWYSPYGNSGISLYQLWNSDGSSAIKNIVSRNISYQNQNLIPFFAAGRVTDGNGIIVDDSRNEQNSSPLGVYPGRTLVENNIIYENGGRGINVFNSDHVDLVNNTSWRNALHPDITSDLAIVNASDVRVINSIFVADPAKMLLAFSNATAVSLFNNLVSGPGNFGVGTAAGGTAQGNLTGDPLFVAVAARDFRLASGSPAINAGRSGNAAAIDFFARLRPRGGGFDIGAHESF